MLFNRTYNFTSKQPADEIKKRLLGNHLDLHHLDFEILDKEHMLKIIPHAENIDAVKTLPITHVSFASNGKGTRVKVAAHMRRIDAGGPILLTVFCAITMIAGAIVYFMKPEESYIAMALFALGFIIFIVFWFRMERGYFDYVRKIKSYIKTHSA